MSQLDKLPTHLDLRTELHKMVVADLLGPAGAKGEIDHETAVQLQELLAEWAEGVRFTVRESARQEILSRLLKLNHERWEEEVKMVKSAKDAKVGRERKSKVNDGQMGLL